MAKIRRDFKRKIPGSELPPDKKLSIPERLKKYIPFMKPAVPVSGPVSEETGTTVESSEPEASDTTTSTNVSTAATGSTDPGNSTSTTSTSSDMEPFIGEIRMFAANFAPRGWALCNGQIMNIIDNQPLFSLIGTTYGGDGRNTFALPDLRGRSPMHAGTGPGLSDRLIGHSGGYETVTLSNSQIPEHTHRVKCSNQPANNSSPIGKVPAQGQEIYADPQANDYMHTDMLTNTGGSQPHPNMHPFLAVNFIIALEGIYPPRS